MAASAADYRKRLAQEQQRYARGPNAANESARDAAVRATNIAMGYGNSTALRYPQNAPAPKRQKAPKPGGGKDITTKTASPYKLARNVMTTPTSATSYYPAQGPTTQPSYYPVMSTPTSAPGSTWPTMSPTSMYQPTLSPTSQPSDLPVMSTPTSATSYYPARGPTTQLSDLPTRSPTSVFDPNFGTRSPTSVPGSPGMPVPNYGTGSHWWW